MLDKIGHISSLNEEKLSNDENHEQLLKTTKKQVKAIMEEAVTKKFIHEESPYVLQLSATVELCLLDGVKRRTAGFLRSNKLANLFAKVGKAVPAVNQIISQIEDTEAKQKSFDRSLLYRSPIISVNGTKINEKHLWVRMALTGKVLDKIVEYLVQNQSKFYHPTSIMADPVRGKILAALLVGPCALDYTKLKTQDHYWSDPPADELLQRHRLHSRVKGNTPSKRPALDRPSSCHTTSTESLDRNIAFREYVESLHQNSKISLLYGKNNVIIQPEEAGSLPGYLSLHKNENKIMIKWTPNELMRGGQEGSSTMGSSEDLESSNTEVGISKKNISLHDPDSYFNFVISVDIREIVYLHCHHQTGKGGTLVLVGQDGVQWPPILFPPGGHLLSFLTCLENGLESFGHLDPPLWSQKGKGKVFPRLRRKTRRRSEPSVESDDFTDFVFRIAFSSDSSNSNFLTRLPVSIDRRRLSDFSLLQPITNLPDLLRNSFSESNRKQVVTENSESSSISRSVVIRQDLITNRPVSFCQSRVQPPYASDLSSRTKLTNQLGFFESSDEYVPRLDMYTWEQDKPRHYNQPNGSNPDSHSVTSISGYSLETLCNSMRRQIISRAFCGWLAHCRHLATVRANLTPLVNKKIVSANHPSDASVGVTMEIWELLAPNNKLTDLDQLARYVYYGGVPASHLRPIVWLYLLGHYSPGDGEEDRRNCDDESKRKYKEIRTIYEEIKEKYGNNVEIPFGALASTSSERSSWSSSYVPAPFLQQQSSSFSDVFMPGPDPSNKLDKHAMVEDWRRSVKKNRNARERRMRLRKRAKSDDSHVPYSSISTTTSFELYSSMSTKSFSFDDDFDGLKPVTEESEKSSVSDVCNNSAGDESFENNIKPPAEQNKNKHVEAGFAHDRLFSNKSELIDSINLNLTQIEKDVNRCDRNYEYFARQDNLTKLNNIMGCFVLEHPEIGYVQGMCDLAAPLLVLFDDESIVYSCFAKLMKRITFQKGDEMDARLSNLRLLIQALDGELFEHLRGKNDQIPFFFCYRWFLLEFKRELSYNDDVFAVWECSWAANSCSTPDFGLFFALAMLENYRDVIIENDMDFPAIVKFFNEMAERHDACRLLEIARKLVHEVQQMIQK